ncbi:hypothetical protein ACFFX1_25240 [Dactylosporangium sucinum]|uniref:DAGKc domain-containing protein n=1 Tax=Dactylosporangium sucinum TaxID=1424081 RepID=A0A917WJJ6_9ACTN|nr:hypothetical protein GCM10007977_009800 [Dactylosporangium sucinum]
MVDVVVLALGEGTECACDNGACGTRTPILACRDALRTASAEVRTVVAHTDAEIDSALRTDARIIVATAADAQLRAVMRRLVRLHAPAPSKRPDDLPGDRTVPDLPPIGILPLGPDATDLATRLGLPREPAVVAAAVLGGRTRRLDLLRNDGGSVTLDGALIGGVDAGGSARTFLARVEVDDAVLADGTEPVLMSVIANASRYATVDGLPLVTGPAVDDGVLDVAVALPRASRRLFRQPRVEIEVRRAHGRAVAVTPRVDVPFVDDGVEGSLTRKRSWWMERAAWAVYIP